MSDLMPELILRILMEYEQGRLRSDDITQFVKESIGKEAANKLIKDINKLLTPGIAMLYGGITKSTVPIKYYNRLQNAVLKNSDKIARMNAEVAFLESERMRIDRYLTVKSLVKIRESLLIWKEFLAKKKPYGHRVNAMSRYYFPSSMPIGRQPQKNAGQEYDEYNEFIKFRHGRQGEKDKEGRTVIKGISYKPFLKAYITVIDLLIEFPVCQKDAALDALQMILHYIYDDDRSIHDALEALQDDSKVLPETIKLIRKKL